MGSLFHCSVTVTVKKFFFRPSAHSASITPWLVMQVSGLANYVCCPSSTICPHLLNPSLPTLSFQRPGLKFCSCAPISSNWKRMWKRSTQHNLSWRLASSFSCGKLWHVEAARALLQLHSSASLLNMLKLLLFPVPCQIRRLSDKNTDLHIQCLKSKDHVEAVEDFKGEWS